LTCLGPGDLRKKTITGKHQSVPTMALVTPKSVHGVSELGQRRMEKRYGDGAGYGWQHPGKGSGRHWGTERRGGDAPCKPRAPFPAGSQQMLRRSQLHPEPQLSHEPSSPHLVFTLLQDRACFSEQIPC